VLVVTSVLVSLTIALAGVPPAEPAASEPAIEARDATATTAYADAQHLVEQRRYDEAIVKLDLASDLEPTWAEPVKLRADVFAKLAEKHHPNAAFTSARAIELQRLVELEPGVDVDRRKNEIAALQQQSQKAAEIERRHRKLAVPAILVILSSASLIAAGAMLYGMTTREALEPTAWRQERRDKAGIALMAMGGILLPPAIVLGVLAGKQARRDTAVRDFNVETDRRPRRPNVAVAPTGVVLRF
jgi:hypothetical protein